ncbi:hypothetical protein [Nocardia sp. NPDC020380]|uniref:hypothetical protein n=1 Tax=Nocardia sp. NPDC020380 TaxID=3364309 RepID=UPI00379AEBA4
MPHDDASYLELHRAHLVDDVRDTHALHAAALRGDLDMVRQLAQGIASRLGQRQQLWDTGVSVGLGCSVADDRERL